MVSFRYVTLYVQKDALAQIAGWYVSRLGLAILWESADFVMLGGQEGARIAFHSGEPLSAPHRVQLHFQVEDVDDTCRQLRAEGVAFEEEPHDTEWGYRMARLADPAGHTVELYTEIATGD